MRSMLEVGNVGGPVFVCRRKGLNQRKQLEQRNNKTPLFENLTSVSALGDKLKSCGGEGGLFHKDLRLSQALR